ncbi:hypothetical protein NEOLEDRAFT_1133999 [Neolentinus lepideus HHB14362 ss-1]|uniref:Uncharacterized protein n=1 Tax=Neolentinus lepideus HHB14362 ss-1 TaxID=1314782 RepID=A0A165SI94_9AGAM|nr:hypothetical protein NEOLEDRAFT_1133999 [Neolentinus lepideus HHB14362 ss-1]
MPATLPGGYKPSTAHRTLSPLLFPLYLSSLPLSSALTLTLAATVLNLRWSDVEHSIRATSTSGSPLQGFSSMALRWSAVEHSIRQYQNYKYRWQWLVNYKVFSSMTKVQDDLKRNGRYSLCYELMKETNVFAFTSDNMVSFWNVWSRSWCQGEREKGQKVLCVCARQRWDFTEDGQL